MTPSPDRTPSRVVPGATLLRVAARLVPASHRDDWLEEWTAEATHAWRIAHRASPTSFSATRLRVRCLGAVIDAMWMRRRHRSSAGRQRMFGHDLQFAARSLARRPAFTSIVVGTLALCIGANTAVFTVVNSVLRHGLPYADLDRLVAVWSNDTRNQHDRNQVSVGDYDDWRARNRSFVDLAGFFPAWNATYTAPDVAERIDVGVVTANFLTVLGNAPAFGRGFVEGEDQRAAPRTVILSHGFWTRMFNGNRSVIGRSITLDGEPYTVVGVMPADFTFPQARVDVIAPLPMLGSYLDRREVHLLAVVGRLRPGATLESAQRDMARVGEQLAREHPAEDAGFGVTTLPLAEDLLGDVRRPILLLFAAVCIVLLIGCVNVGSLMLARTAGRAHEIAVRVAMGAEPRAILRQLLTESLLVALAAGLLGVGIAVVATAAISNMLPPAIARIGHVRVDGTVLAFTLFVSLASALLSGLAPAVHAAAGGALRAINETPRGASMSRAHRRAQRTLVVADLALALVLTVSAGLLVNSFVRLSRTATGFSAANVVKMKLSLTAAAYPRAQQRRQLFDALLRRAREIPHVRSVGAVTRFPLFDANITTQLVVEGAPPSAGGQYPDADLRAATGDYFAAMGIPLIEGRVFAAGEPIDSGAVPVAIVNRTAAREFFGGASPVGKRARLGGASGPLFTIVGVVGDVADGSLRSAPRPQVFQSAEQTAPRSLTFVLRYDGPLAPVMAGMRRAVASLDRTLPLADVRTVGDVVHEASRGDRFLAVLLSGFSALALLLAALGTYGVIAQSVASRRREIGIRLALGARGGDVSRMVLREGVTLLAIALPIAIVGVVAASRAMRGLLFGVDGSDPATIGGATLTLALVTLAACYLPAARAARVDPTTAMRSVE